MSNKKILLIGGITHFRKFPEGAEKRMEVMEDFYTGAKIRRLLPIETFRFQGYSDEFFYKCQAVNSDTRLYQQAGNTITVSVIQAIIKNLLHILK